MFSFRTYFLSKILEKAKNKFQAEYNTKLHFDKAKFYGFDGLYFKNLSLITSENDTIFFADSLYARPKLRALISGNIRAEEIYSRGIFINLVKNDSIDNFSRFLKKESQDSTSEKQELNLSKFADRLFDKFFNYVPGKSSYFGSKVKLSYNDYQLTFFSDSLIQESTNYAMQLSWIGMSTKSKVLLKGQLNAGDRQISTKIVSADTGQIYVPILPYFIKLYSRFDSLSASLKVDMEAEELLLTGNGRISGLALNHQRISKEDVVFKSGRLDFQTRIGKNYIQLDSTSIASMNAFNFSPFIKYVIEPKTLELKFIENTFEADSFFNSLPEGLFDNLKGLKTEGSLGFKMNFFLPFENPDSLKFSSTMQKKDFKIKAFGDSDFRTLGYDFKHEVYENDRIIKTFIVGPENPNFTALDAISPYLKFCILTSEDGNFFTHRGFNEDAFREAIATNIKEKKFARGGSTISMQLVKNVFLTRKKNVARKLEETIIVWLIENMRLASKERMFEVYLNIIEWGPGIYGIKEASYFYFNKLPSELTLNESIYLASIVPRPKAFKYSFDKEGKLKPHYKSYYKLLTSIMLRRQQITEIDTIGLRPEVVLLGEAKKSVILSDTIVNITPVEQEDILND